MKTEVTFSRKVVVTGDPRTLGERLLKARVEAGLSQRALAAKCGVSDPFISQVETGQTGLTVGRAVKLADALGLSLDYLCRGWGPEQAEKFVGRERAARLRALLREVPKDARLRVVRRAGAAAQR